MKRRKRRKKGRRLYFLAAGAFGAVFLVSFCMVLGIVLQANREKSDFEDLAELVRAYPEQEASEDGGSTSYAVLKERNKDFFAWISISGTVLDYPVMHTPDDPEYYLRRNFEGEASQGGVPFLDAACYEGCGNYLIYGHNMKNGSMFASLLSYADQDYWEQHPSIRFDTLTETAEYQVAAAFYTEVYPREAENVFRFYQYTDLSDPSVFSEYAEQVQSAALYDTGVNIKPGDQLLTLSTCSYHTKEGRFVVVARRGDV